MLHVGVVLPKPDYAAMETALKEACVTHNLQPTDYFLLKVCTPQPPAPHQIRLFMPVFHMNV